MISKEKLIQQIENFPEKMEIDELIEKLLFIEKLEKRIELSVKEEVVSKNELKEEIEQWFKSNGS